MATKKLTKWHEALGFRTVDIVGDFGGKELFLIHGDSLLLHCINSSQVDFNAGAFQLLHAISAVETFLNHWKSRGCSFHVVFFDDSKHGVFLDKGKENRHSPDTPQAKQIKYRLTRTILIQHLQRCATDDSSNSDIIFCFPSIGSDAFTAYLAENLATFLLCHDGFDESGDTSEHQNPYQYLIHEFLRLRRSVALISSVEFSSSRVFTSMVTSAPVIPSLQPPAQSDVANQAHDQPASSVNLDRVERSGSSCRERATVAILSKLLQTAGYRELHLASIAMAFHTAYLGRATLSGRSFPNPSTDMPKPSIDNCLSFMDRFALEATSVLNSTTSEGSWLRDAKPDLFDLTRFDLREISLEPRDCLTLWACMKQYQTQGYELNPALDPNKTLSGIATKSDVIAWVNKLKVVLNTWMRDSASPFEAIRTHLLASTKQFLEGREDRDAESVILPLLSDLHSAGGLPAILFNYDRVQCENTLMSVLSRLESAEKEFKESDKQWAQQVNKYEAWKVLRAKQKDLERVQKATKDEKMRKTANVEASVWESFDIDGALADFSFADHTKLTKSELQDALQTLAWERIQPHFIAALKRGVGVHHAGVNRGYRQVVEMLFRKGFLTVVIATGTLALGISMPCKTVVFFGDSTYLTALNYRQGSGRAGRRGFDLLGNVVFCNIGLTRAFELMSSRLPDLKGHFPLSTTLVLRTMGLLDATSNSAYATGVVKSLLLQNRIYLRGPAAGMSIRHHLRFSIEYLRRQRLLSATGKPLNFAGLVGHLYFTENAAFAFHSLLKGGYFHSLCSGIHKNPIDTLRNLALVIAHLFNRIPARVGSKYHPGTLDPAVSNLLLPRLPKGAEDILVSNNNETLRKYSRRMQSIHDLCSSVRNGVFLEESAVPYIPIWPHDTDTRLNSYIYTFFKSGDYAALTRDHKIKKGDVWFLLKEFSLVLATVVTSLTNFIEPDGSMDDDDSGPTDDSTTPEMVLPAWEGEGASLVDVLKAFTMLRDEFDEKFRKTWA
ncbi:Uu.00g096790.m01.CDS01 [Anthostomella pinea]|uniref:Uu.00g096790.m01.CDS01 n=1 Tax=Anthostomella pinea TaxID=933095 RepID=A0AAI8VDA3_9PEZI|nr:Uu.00g096790.m01.CDS01 [Anthostomella pinea]